MLTLPRQAPKALVFFLALATTTTDALHVVGMSAVSRRLLGAIVAAVWLTSRI